MKLPRASALALCLLCACSGSNVKPGDRDYPRPNPRPTRFLQLHGSIDESLDVNFRVHWHAANPKCQFATSLLEGAYAWYTAWDPLTVVRKGASFSAQVPVDGVLPGRCDWAFDGVTFGGPKGTRTGLVATNSNPLKTGQSPNGVAELRCTWVAIDLQCRWPENENPRAAVLGGILWWHPEATDLEVHMTLE